MDRFKFYLTLLFAFKLCLCNTITLKGDDCKDSYVDVEYAGATYGSADGLDVQI